MPPVTSIANIQKTPECRLFYPGRETGFRVEQRHSKIYLIQDGRELGQVAGILLDRDQTRGSQLLLTPQFDIRDASLPAAVVRRNGHHNTIQQHAETTVDHLAPAYASAIMQGYPGGPPEGITDYILAGHICCLSRTIVNI